MVRLGPFPRPLPPFFPLFFLHCLPFPPPFHCALFTRPSVSFFGFVLCVPIPITPPIVWRRCNQITNSWRSPPNCSRQFHPMGRVSNCQDKLKLIFKGVQHRFRRVHPLPTLLGTPSCFVDKFLGRPFVLSLRCWKVVHSPANSSPNMCCCTQKLLSPSPPLFPASPRAISLSVTLLVALPFITTELNPKVSHQFPLTPLPTHPFMIRQSDFGLN